MTNLKEETLRILNKNGKSADDVVWVGTFECEMPVQSFWEQADAEYYAGYGLENVNSNLLVVGKDFWLERHEYDGSEWWEFKELPQRPLATDTIKIFNRIG